VRRGGVIAGMLSHGGSGGEAGGVDWGSGATVAAMAQ